MAVTALKAFVHEDDRGFLDGLSEDTFWEFLRPLVKGRTHSGKDRVKELVTNITGIPDGGVQPIKEEHVRLQNAHDLPRYLLYMKKKFADMEKVVSSSPHDNVERAKMDPSDFLETVVTQVAKFLPRLGTQYIQTKSSATGPFTIAIIETEVTQLEIGGLIDQAKGSGGVETAPGRGDRQARIHQARAAWRDPADVFAASSGRGTLVSGLDYDGLQDGESFDPQR